MPQLPRPLVRPDDRRPPADRRRLTVPIGRHDVMRRRSSRRARRVIGTKGLATEGIMRHRPPMPLSAIVRKRSRPHGFRRLRGSVPAISRRTRGSSTATPASSSATMRARRSAERYPADGLHLGFPDQPGVGAATRPLRRTSRAFINHCRRPNCWFEVAGRTIWIRASRRIRVGRGADLRLLTRSAKRAIALPLPARGLPEQAADVVRLSGPRC